MKRTTADQPVRRRIEDKLERRSFAEQLAKGLVAWNGEESLVAALYGPWGSGKSSVKNFALDAIENDIDPKIRPDVVEFNAWQFAGRDLGEALLAQVGKKLGRIDKSELGKRLARRWNAFAAALKIAEVASDGIRKVIVAPFFVGGLLLASSGALASEPTLSRSRLIFSAVVLGIGLIISTSLPIVKAASEFFAARGEAASKTVGELKSELAEELRKRRKSLLVVIDDVDRLTPEEIRAVVQLVKANADLPRMVYLLLFQRDIVEKSLDVKEIISGREFLKKIVQIGFDIPPLTRSQLNTILFNELQELLGDVPDDRFDQVRWGNIYYGGLQHYFESLRDVYRFAATLEFHLGLFGPRQNLEVNPIDLVGLEVLRSFEPEIYQRIRESRELLTMKSSIARKNDGSVKKAIQDIVALAPESKRPMVSRILVDLFPPAGWALDGMNYGSDWEATWTRELRVCVDDLFDRYFAFMVPHGQISQQVMARFLAALKDRSALVQLFMELHNDGLLPAMIEMLESYKETLDLSAADSVVTALLDVGDELPRRAAGLFDIGAVLHATRIVYWYLRRVEPIEAREDILRKAITATTGVLLPCDVVSLEDRSEERKNERYLIREEELPHFRELCVQKIRNAANTGRLIGHPHLVSLLYDWRQWAGEAEPAAWAQKMIDEGHAPIVLDRFVQVGTSQGMGDYVARVHKRLYLKNLADFVPLQKLEDATASLQLEALSAGQREAVQLFRSNLEKHKKGMTDEQIINDE